MTWMGKAHMPPDLATPFASIAITWYFPAIAYLLATTSRPHTDTIMKSVGIPIDYLSLVCITLI